MGIWGALLVVAVVLGCSCTVGAPVNDVAGAGNGAVDSAAKPVNEQVLEPTFKLLPTAEEARAAARGLIDTPGRILHQMGVMQNQATDATAAEQPADKEKIDPKSAEGKSGKNIQTNGCEHKSLALDCGAQCITIHKAVYGRTDASVCPHFGVTPNDLDCMAEATATVKNKCDEENKCSIKVNNELVGDPCRAVLKYLAVEHICEDCAKQALKAVREAERPKRKKPTVEEPVTKEELQAIKDEYVDKTTALLHDLDAKEAEMNANINENSQRLQECIEEVEKRRERLGYQDDTDMQHCLALNTIILAGVDHAIQDQGASNHGSEEWQMEDRDWPVYGEDVEDKAKPAQRHSPCRRSTSVEILVGLQRTIPLWPFHIDDPCPSADHARK